MYHFGLRVGDTDEELRRAGRPRGDRARLSDHTVTHSVYIATPTATRSSSTSTCPGSTGGDDPALLAPTSRSTLSALRSATQALHDDLGGRLVGSEPPPGGLAEAPRGRPVAEPDLAHQRRTDPDGACHLGPRELADEGAVLRRCFGEPAGQLLQVGVGEPRADLARVAEAPVVGDPDDERADRPGPAALSRGEPAHHHLLGEQGRGS